MRYYKCTNHWHVALCTEETWLEFDLKMPPDNRLVFMFKLDELMTMLKCEAQWEKLKRNVTDPTAAPRRHSFIGRLTWFMWPSSTYFQVETCHDWDKAWEEPTTMTAETSSQPQQPEEYHQMSWNGRHTHGDRWKVNWRQSLCENEWNETRPFVQIKKTYYKTRCRGCLYVHFVQSVFVFMKNVFSRS